MSYTCTECDQELVNIITIDGVGWYHLTRTPNVVYEDCPSEEERP
jgi:hypothetical protein